jgi:CrcB protein
VGRFVLVCIGGALGSGARFLVATWALYAFGAGFPRGTLLVNVVGSFLIAFVFDLSLRGAPISPELRLFLTTGVMGGFTTYSSFNYELLRLLEDGAPSSAALYAALTVFGCLSAGVSGLVVARVLVRPGTGALE